MINPLLHGNAQLVANAAIQMIDEMTKPGYWARADAKIKRHVNMSTSTTRRLTGRKKCYK